MEAGPLCADRQYRPRGDIRPGCVEPVFGRADQRSLLLPLHSEKAAEGLTYQVGQPISFREQTAGRAALESLMPTVFLIVLVWIAIPLIVEAAFTSLKRAGTDAESIDIGRVAPLDISHVPAEVRPFADSINLMIARLQVGIDGEKRFIADAAHEPRTPIAALQLGIDNLENAHDPIVRSERLRELREVAVRTASMIRQLLELARADAQRSPDATVKVLDVREIVRTLIADLLPVAYERSIDLGGQAVRRRTCKRKRGGATYRSAKSGRECFALYAPEWMRGYRCVCG